MIKLIRQLFLASLLAAGFLLAGCAGQDPDTGSQPWGGPAQWEDQRMPGMGF